MPPRIGPQTRVGASFEVNVNISPAVIFRNTRASPSDRGEEAEPEKEACTPSWIIVPNKRWASSLTHEDLQSECQRRAPADTSLKLTRLHGVEKSADQSLKALLRGGKLSG